jgi:molybdopterin-guanine dinucleotide biosynthesis protein A
MLHRAFSAEEAALDALLSHDAAQVWAGQLAAAREAMSRGDWSEAERAHQLAWRRVGPGRARQALTLQLIGQRTWQHGDPYRAAAFFELARLLRGPGDAAARVRSELALARTRHQCAYDAIVVSGGRASRLGGVKAERPLAGWPLLDHVLLAVSSAGRRIVAGPQRAGLGEPAFVRESPPGSGPVAAISAALDAVEHDLVAVLAADLPFIGPGLELLRAGLRAREAVLLVDADGRVNYLAALWRTDALRRAVAAVGPPAGLAVRSLYSGADVAHAADHDGVGADIDTADDLARAERRIRDEVAGLRPSRSPGRLPSTPLAWPELALPVRT